MKQLVRRIGQTIALTLPVVLVTTGTLAVTRVPWAPPTGLDQQVVAAASSNGTIGRTSSDGVSGPSGSSAPQEALRSSLLAELQAHDPGSALDLLERTMRDRPALTPYCTDLAASLGRAAVTKYRGDIARARSFARPVCDGAFAAGTSTH